MSESANGCTSDPCGSQVCQTQRDRARLLDAIDAVLALADTLEVRAAANHARATAAATHHWQDSGAYQALELGQSQAAHEIRAAITKALEGKQ
jgi:hypothetical protein